MIKLLNNPTFDNERNILNADLFVNNLKQTLKAFNLHTKVTYVVYRNITIYNITWTDDKTYEEVLEYRKEISLSLGIRSEELEVKKISDNEIEITVQNMKREPLTLKEVLTEYKKDNTFNEKNYRKNKEKKVKKRFKTLRKLNRLGWYNYRYYIK